MPDTQINPERIFLARESRGISQTQLSEMIGLSGSMLSKVESGSTPLSPEVIGKIADITKYPLSFFFQPGALAPEAYAYRRREKVAAKLVDTVEAQVNILRLIIQNLTRDIKIEPALIPFIVLNAETTPADVARVIRKSWKIPDGPIQNLTSIIEENGIPVAAFQFATERVDSRNTLTDDKLPLFCINSHHYGDRQRFSIAYQLGHLLMHTFGIVSAEQDISHEANVFAANLLMPELQIRDAIGERAITLPLLAELKRRWRVSMISLLYRCDDLGYLTENQKRYLVQQFNQKKLRRREPIELDIAPEQPTLIRSWLTTLMRQEKLRQADLPARLHLTHEDYITYFG